MVEENNKGKDEIITKKVENLVVYYRRKRGKQTINGESVDLTGGEIIASYPRAEIDFAGKNIVCTGKNIECIRINGETILSPENVNIEKCSYKYYGL